MESTPNMANSTHTLLKTSLLTTDNPVFCNFLCWSSILAIKMLLMSFLTGAQRFRKKSFVNPEDAKLNNIDITVRDEDVERVRRAHRNDMENILPYFTIGLLYITLDPNQIVATVFFRIATIARILHTIVYAIYPIAAARTFCFFVHLIITMYMAVEILIRTIKCI